MLTKHTRKLCDRVDLAVINIDKDIYVAGDVVGLLLELKNELILKERLLRAYESVINND